VIYIKDINDLLLIAGERLWWNCEGCV